MASAGCRAAQNSSYPCKFSRSCSDNYYLQKLRAAHEAGQLQFFGQLAHLAEPKAFAAYLAPLRKIESYSYLKPPFGGPEAVLAYLSRYTHRVAIANSRLIACNDTGITFRYQAPPRRRPRPLQDNEARNRRVHPPLPHPCPAARLQYASTTHGLFANGNRAANIARARDLLAVQPAQSNPRYPETTPEADQPRMLPRPCPCCGGRMIIIETFTRGCEPSHRPTPAPLPIRIDTS